MSEENYWIEVPNDDYLMHYGKGHLDGGHSGRYPWGSGDVPYQHEEGYLPRYASPKGFLDDYNKMRKEGLKEDEIAKACGLKSSTELRAAHSVALILKKNSERDTAVKLHNEGKSNRTIAKEMGYRESQESLIRDMLKEEYNMRQSVVLDIATKIKDQVDILKYVDVGEGVEKQLGISTEKLNQALYILQAEYGYEIRTYKKEQLTNPGHDTTMKVAVAPGTPRSIFYHQDFDNRVRRLEDFGNNPDPHQAMNLKPSFSKPTSLARNRLGIIYGKEGAARDGLIELRPGVKDLSLGSDLYSQVRIMVDNDKGEPAYYLKGMAVYNSDLPEGIDVRFNTHHEEGSADKDTLKKLKRIESTGEIDWDNPFKSAIKENGGQNWYIDDDGQEKLGLVNKRAGEGDWGDWSKSLPSQFLAKQNPKLIRQQLDYTIADKYDQLEEINRITNPAIKIKLLKDFAEDCDSQAGDLKAASLPRQSYHVILPVLSLKDNECYAPNFENGEKIALVRFPHAGPFEMPILTVNNKNQEAIKMLGKTPQDVVGINTYNASIMSGADFDGDTVIAIPVSEQVNITAKNPLKGLKDFNDIDEYPPKYKLDDNGNSILDAEGDPIIISKVMPEKMKQKHMGMISNLITDMTLMGADDDELARAVRHSMVVVDAPKHKLDYTKSEIDNGIYELKRKYQLHDYYDLTGKLHVGSTGAATILSRSRAQVSAPVKEGYQKIDPKTGKYVNSREDNKKVFDYKHAPYTEVEYVDDITGEVKKRKLYDFENGPYKDKMRRSDWMSEVDDAMELVRDPNNKVEVMYAQFANSLKSIANEARKQAVNTPKLKYNPEMALKYSEQVEHLNAELKLAALNKPREREAQVLGSILFNEYTNELTEPLSKSDEKKYRDKFLKKARAICGASRHEIDITDKDWEAIQAGAISHTKAGEIFLRANQEHLRDLATPKEGFAMTPVKEAKIQAMAANGYSTSEIAKSVGTSTSTIAQYLKERR